MPNVRAMVSQAGPTVVNGGSFSHNTASDGAGFANEDSTVTLNGVGFDANTATDAVGGGGGIYNYSGGDTILNDDDSFTGNTAANGAGLFNAGESTVSHAQFSQNSASADGGAIYNAADATVTVGHSRITGNFAGADGGGGIYNAGTDGAVTLTGSHVAHNDPDNCAPTASVTGCTG
jgi:predicted outer membrane repeat protein